MKTNSLSIQKISSVGFLSFCSLLSTSHVWAANFLDITITDYGNLTADDAPTTAARAKLDQLVATLETSVNSNFPNIDLVPFTDGTAKSTAMAGSGVGLDYASDFDFGFLGFNLALATNATVKQIMDLSGGRASVEDVPGIAAVGAITLGLNFKTLPQLPIPFIDSSRGKGYLSYYSANRTIAGNASRPSVTLGMTTFAAQAQYKLLSGVSVGLGTLKWTGVDFSTGLRYSSAKVEISQAINNIPTQTIDFENVALGNGSIGFNGTAVIGINSKTFSMPVEVSSSVRLLHVLGLFAGTGMDLNFGGATSSGRLKDGVFDITNDGSQSIGDVKASAAADLTGKGKPGFANVKYFAGVQAEVLAVAVSLQYAGSLTNSSKAVNLGVKAFW